MVFDYPIYWSLCITYSDCVSFFMMGNGVSRPRFSTIKKPTFHLKWNGVRKKFSTNSEDPYLVFTHSYAIICVFCFIFFGTFVNIPYYNDIYNDWIYNDQSLKPVSKLISETSKNLKKPKPEKIGYQYYNLKQNRKSNS